MSIQEYIANKREIQNAICSFIDDNEQTEEKYREMSKLLTDPKSINNKEELKQVVLIISSISENHHRCPNFFTKIGRIFQLIKNEIKTNFTNIEICSFFKNNRRILLLLLKENIIMIDSQILSDIKSLDNCISMKMDEFFSPELGDNKYTNLSISSETFFECRDIGENDGYICELIRNDSVEEFIAYINKNNISVDSRIIESIFETNLFLIGKKPLLIEYAAFFGSIQIFQYLKMNKATMNSDLWLYAIHSNNAEIIQLLEENRIESNDGSFEECFVESIKCHHNEISTYIKDNLLDIKKRKSEKYILGDEFEIIQAPIVYHNYEFIPDDVKTLSNMFFYLLYNDYTTLVKYINEEMNIFFNIDDYKAVNRINDQFYFASIVISKNDNKKYLIKATDDNHYEGELTRLMMCRYPSILSLKGFRFTDVHYPSFLTDYYDLTLLDYINDKKKKKLDNESYTKTSDYIITLGVAIALRFLRKNNINHNFLSPYSILLDENLYPIISDVEITERMLVNVNDIYHCMCYMSPEQVEEIAADNSNVFSYSFILYHLLTMKNIFDDRKIKNLTSFIIYNEIREGYRPDPRCIENDIIIEFLEKCWDTNPENRPTFDEILEVITSEDFYSFFEPFDHESVKKYLEIYGNEYDILKNKF